MKTKAYNLDIVFYCTLLSSSGTSETGYTFVLQFGQFKWSNCARAVVTEIERSWSKIFMRLKINFENREILHLNLKYYCHHFDTMHSRREASDKKMERWLIIHHQTASSTDILGHKRRLRASCAGRRPGPIRRGEQRNGTQFSDP